MLTILAWVPRIARFFGMFRGVVGFVTPMWPYVSSFVRRVRQPRAIAQAY
ncbi:hypothetical protein [Ferroacidibacillus organovorans]|nr:hypothetical protein [Ferroacidibacillus organovorans]